MKPTKQFNNLVQPQLPKSLEEQLVKAREKDIFLRLEHHDRMAAFISDPMQKIKHEVHRIAIRDELIALYMEYSKSEQAINQFIEKHNSIVKKIVEVEGWGSYGDVYGLTGLYLTNLNKLENYQRKLNEIKISPDIVQLENKLLNIEYTFEFSPIDPIEPIEYVTENKTSLEKANEEIKQIEYTLHKIKKYSNDLDCRSSLVIYNLALVQRLISVKKFQDAIEKLKICHNQFTQDNKDKDAKQQPSNDKILIQKIFGLKIHYYQIHCYEELKQSNDAIELCKTSIKMMDEIFNFLESKKTLYFFYKQAFNQPAKNWREYFRNKLQQLLQKKVISLTTPQQGQPEPSLAQSPQNIGEIKRPENLPSTGNSKPIKPKRTPEEKRIKRQKHKKRKLLKKQLKLKEKESETKPKEDKPAFPKLNSQSPASLEPRGSEESPSSINPKNKSPTGDASQLSLVSRSDSSKVPVAQLPSEIKSENASLDSAASPLMLPQKIEQESKPEESSPSIKLNRLNRKIKWQAKHAERRSSESSISPDSSDLISSEQVNFPPTLIYVPKGKADFPKSHRSVEPKQTVVPAKRQPQDRKFDITELQVTPHLIETFHESSSPIKRAHYFIRWLQMLYQHHTNGKSFLVSNLNRRSLITALSFMFNLEARLLQFGVQVFLTDDSLRNLLWRRKITRLKFLLFGMGNAALSYYINAGNPEACTPITIFSPYYIEYCSVIIGSFNAIGVESVLVRCRNERFNYTELGVAFEMDRAFYSYLKPNGFFLSSQTRLYEPSRELLLKILLNQPHVIQMNEKKHLLYSDFMENNKADLNFWFAYVNLREDGPTRSIEIAMECAGDLNLIDPVLLNLLINSEKMIQIIYRFAKIHISSDLFSQENVLKALFTKMTKKLSEMILQETELAKFAKTEIKQNPAQDFLALQEYLKEFFSSLSRFGLLNFFLTSGAGSMFPLPISPIPLEQTCLGDYLITGLAAQQLSAKIRGEYLSIYHEHMQFMTLVWAIQSNLQIYQSVTHEQHGFLIKQFAEAQIWVNPLLYPNGGSLGETLQRYPKLLLLAQKQIPISSPFIQLPSSRAS